MPLRPEGARLLVIRSSDGTVLYEGDGRVEGGIDPAAIPVVGPDEPRQVWSFEGPGARDGARHWAVQSAEEAERSWGEVVRSMAELNARARARNLSSAVQQILEAHRVGEPDIEDLQRAAEASPAWQERFGTGTVRAEVALEEFQRAVTEPVPAYDELIESTRAEFPYDPLDYGVFGREEMAWTPPEDGREVPRCP